MKHFLHNIYIFLIQYIRLLKKVGYRKIMQNEKIFEVKTRKHIYTHISRNPGLHFRELVRLLNIPGSTLSYHLKYLEKKCIILRELENGYSRYYVSKKIGKNDKKLLNILRETVPRNIILFLSLYPDTSQTDMIIFAKKWKKHPSKIGYYLNKHHTTLSFHLKKLIEEDFIETNEIGNEIRYKLKNHEDVIDLLIRYDKRILAEAFGRFLEYFE